MPVQQSLEAAQPPRVTPEIPELKRHKGTGQAYILSGRKRTYFGRHSLPETHRKYHAFCAELLASGGVALQKGPGATVERLCAGYLEHARRTYVRPDGSPSGEARNYESALGLLVEL